MWSTFAPGDARADNVPPSSPPGRRLPEARIWGCDFTENDNNPRTGVQDTPFVQVGPVLGETGPELCWVCPDLGVHSHPNPAGRPSNARARPPHNAKKPKCRVPHVPGGDIWGEHGPKPDNHTCGLVQTTHGRITGPLLTLLHRATPGQPSSRETRAPMTPDVAGRRRGRDPTISKPHSSPPEIRGCSQNRNSTVQPPAP